jgi:four helix bundle protein
MFIHLRARASLLSTTMARRETAVTASRPCGAAHASNPSCHGQRAGADFGPSQAAAPAASGLRAFGLMRAGVVSELACWQLANELSTLAAAVLSRPGARANRRFCSQMQAAASAGPLHIAEGFLRCDHGELAQFLKIAIGSIQETRHLIFEAFDRGYITATERDEGVAIGAAAIAAAVRFRLFLLRTGARPARATSSA